MTNPKDIVAEARKAAKEKRSKKEKVVESSDDEDDKFTIEICITVKKNGKKFTKKQVNNAISDWCGNVLASKA